MHYCLFTPVSYQTEVDAQTDHHSPSHACERAGSMSFLLFIAMSPAQSLVLLMIIFSKCEKNPAWKWNQQREKQILEMEKKGRVLVTLFKLRDLGISEANTPPWTSHLWANEVPLLLKLIWVRFLTFSIKRILTNTPSILYFIKLQKNQKEVFISKKVINPGIKVSTWLSFPALINSEMQRYWCHWRQSALVMV